jgi:hypothetical protein
LTQAAATCSWLLLGFVVPNPRLQRAEQFAMMATSEPDQIVRETWAIERESPK